MKHRYSAFLLILCLLMAGMVAQAVPARKGVWRQITLSDGTTLRVQLCGDEHMHFWRSADGRTFTHGDEGWEERVWSVECAMLNEGSDASGKLQVQNLSSLHTPRSTFRKSLSAEGGREGFLGKKRGLIILVNFADNGFSMADPQALYTDIANKEGYSEGRFRGSVADYFKAQSGGAMEIEFDVVGPVALSQPMAYYGKNNSYGDDLRPDEMVVEACGLVDDEVDFSRYVWGDDGQVSQVFILYAGYGENAGADETTIWPHEANLSDLTSGAQEFDGVTVDTYACSCELSGTEGDEVDGIGTFCHEFSHCLGFPDTYDLNYVGYYGMGRWDLMDNGCYNDDGFCPAGYTAYERMAAGWLQPIELTEDVQVEAMRPLAEGGEAYILYNEGLRSEFYLLENRGNTGWDAALPGAGLLVTHVDYDEAIWQDNIVNTIDDYADGGNDHQRLTVVHADGDDDRAYWNVRTYQYTHRTEDGDPYPYEANDSLTNNSTPAATLWNANTDGKRMLNQGLTGITRNADGTIAFCYHATSQTIHQQEVVCFHETFDQCAGTGGNDDQWSGTIATALFVPDVAGWSGSNKYGGDRCARFGTTRTDGNVQSPLFEVADGADLSFTAAPWSGDGNTISVFLNSQLLGSYTMQEGQWNTFNVPLPILPGRSARLLFVGGKRFFLDEVKVAVPPTTGIEEQGVRGVGRENEPSSYSLHPASCPSRVYTLGGQYVGNTLLGLPAGLYVVKASDGTARVVVNS